MKARKKIIGRSMKSEKVYLKTKQSMVEKKNF